MTEVVHLDAGPRDNTALCGAASQHLTNEWLRVDCGDCLFAHDCIVDGLTTDEQA